MVRFTLTFGELLTTYSCVSTMAAVQGTTELENLSDVFRQAVSIACDNVMADIDVELGRGDS